MIDDERPDHVIEDHPRADEVQAIWSDLSLRRPASIEEMGKLSIIDHEFPLPLSIFDEAHLPVSFLEGRSADQVAFGLAYSMCLNPMRQFLDDSIGELDKSLLNSPIGDSLAPLLGLAGGLGAIWRGVTRFAERERAAIEAAVDWVHRAGFDPNAGVKMFMSLSGWFEAQAAGKEKVEASTMQKVKAVAFIGPLVGVLSVPMSKDPPMATAVDRAAAVRTAIVARGWHHR